jgi:pyruvate dehydrogenase E2 component (dihydrolipoamide acetyltransferase)
MASEHGLNLGDIQGTGPSGRIVRDDVAAAIAGNPTPVARPAAAAVAPAAPVVAPPPAAAAGATVVPLTSMRRTITRRLTQSWQSAPHFYVSMDIDMGATLELRKQINAPLAKDQQVSINDIIVKACGVALAQFPYLNASYVEEGIQLNPNVNVSIAVAIELVIVTAPEVPPPEIPVPAVTAVMSPTSLVIHE